MKYFTIDSMNKVVEGIIMQLIPFVKMEQKVIEMLVIVIQSLKVLHRRKNLLYKRLQVIQLE